MSLTHTGMTTSTEHASMADVKEDFHGSLSSTPRAKAVRAYFEENGVPGHKIGVVDNCRPHGQRYAFESRARYVTVWEKPADSEDDLTPSEFSAYLSAVNVIVNKRDDCRFTDTDETRCAISHAYIDSELMSQQKPNPADAGQDLADPSENGTESPAADSAGTDVFHHGGNRFTVVRQTPSDDSEDAQARVYRVDMDKPLSTGEPVEPVMKGQPTPDTGEITDVIAAVVSAGPSYREGPQEQLSVNVGTPQGNAQSTESSGDTNGNDTSDSSDGGDVEVVTNAGTGHDYDAEELEGNVDQWLTNYSNVKGDIQTGLWDLSFKKITNPQNGQSELGVLIEVEPWGTPYWDNSAGAWSSDDGSVPQEWKDHQAAMRSIFSQDDGPVKGFSVDNPDSDYDDWYNYVPAEEAEDLT